MFTTEPFLLGLAILIALAVLVLLVLVGDWWNLLDAISLVLHRWAVQGRARSRRFEAELDARWTQVVE